MAIKHKITLSVSLLLILILVAFWLALKLQLQQTVAQQTDTLGNILARQTADSVTELVLANDVLGLNVVVNQLARANGVANITITDVDGRQLTSTRMQGLREEDGSTPYVAPVTLQGAIAGYVSLSLDESFLANPVTRPDAVFFLIIGAGLVLVFAASHAIAAQVTTPVLELVRMTEADDDTDPDALVVNRRDEFGLLQQRIADLIWRQRELEEQIDVIGAPREDPEDASGLKAERRTVTLLHVQVANSAKALDLLHPGTLSTLLQQYQFYLRQAARLYRGVVIRVNGDSALVAFDTRRCQDEHAFDALCCAQLFMRLMQKVAEDQRVRKAQALEFCVAVFSGDAYFSPIWRKQKADEEKQRQESVIGKSVDFVMELASHCRAGEILVSESSFALADGNNRFGAQQSRKVALDSDEASLVIYTLPATAGTHSDLLERQRQHLLPDQTQGQAQG
ncbi:MAG: adenylate/guanylate cyclase domain-containing protein [Pseudomonadota bacterium]|nr:adenylate/guanylate cyclase domain-containing protein [Pseudomonadota bacterium]